MRVESSNEEPKIDESRVEEMEEWVETAEILIRSKMKPSGWRIELLRRKKGGLATR